MRCGEGSSAEPPVGIAGASAGLKHGAGERSFVSLTKEKKKNNNSVAKWDFFFFFLSLSK